MLSYIGETPHDIVWLLCDNSKRHEAEIKNPKTITGDCFKMKKGYEQPDIKVIVFGNEDVVMTSDGKGEGQTDPFDKDNPFGV